MGKSTENKRRHFDELIDYIPFCSTRIVSMTSLTCIDIEKIFQRNRIEPDAEICNFENLSSPKWVGNMTEDEFLSQWKRRMSEVCGYYDGTKMRTFFKDIFDVDLHSMFGEGAELALVDTCSPYSMKIAKWVASDATVDAIAMDGAVGLNVNLHRSTDVLNGNGRPLAHQVSMIMKGDYDNAETEYCQRWKIHNVINDIESLSNGRLRALAALNYWDDKRSDMAYFIFRREK